MKTQHLFPLFKTQHKYSDTYKVSTAKEWELDLKHLVFQRNRIRKKKNKNKPHQALYLRSPQQRHEEVLIFRKFSTDS